MKGIIFQPAKATWLHSLGKDPAKAAALGGDPQTRRVISWGNSESMGAIQPRFPLVDWSRAWVDGQGSGQEYLHVPFAHPNEGWEKNPDRDTFGRVASRFVVGQRLYVKEAWHALADFDHLPPSKISKDHPVYFAGSHANLIRESMDIGKLRSPLFLPEHFARTILEVTQVRAQLVREISERDALLEGVHVDELAPGCPTGQYRKRPGEGPFVTDPRIAFKFLFEDLNGADAWDKWAWAISFRILEVR